MPPDRRAWSANGGDQEDEPHRCRDDRDDPDGVDHAVAVQAAAAGAEEVGVDLALHDRPPVRLRLARPDPRRQRHPAAEVERGRGRNPHHRGGAVEAQRRTVAPAGPGRALDRAGVARVGGVRGDPPGARVEPVRRHQAPLGRDRRVHVTADLGRRQCALEDADLVDEPVEVLAVRLVAADPQRRVRCLDPAGRGVPRDLAPVHVEPLHCAVVRERDVGPATHVHSVLGHGLRDRAVERRAAGGHERAALARQHPGEQQQDAQRHRRDRQRPVRRPTSSGAAAGDRDRQEQEWHGHEIPGVDAVRSRQRQHRRAVPRLHPDDGAADRERHYDTGRPTQRAARVLRRHDGSTAAERAGFRRIKRDS